MTGCRRAPHALAAALVAVVGTLLLLGLLSNPALANAGDLFASPGGVGDCSQPAPCDLQMALIQASDGGTVYVAGGTYTGTGDAVINVTRSITLYGGWDGTTAVPPVRDPEENPTTLDGEGHRRAVYITGDITPTLGGLWLTNGSTTENGGGVYVRNAHPIISGCYIYSNTAQWTGGGVAINDSTTVKLMASYVYRNAANSGGGIGVDSSRDVTLSGNHVFSNTAWLSDGGGVNIYKSDDLTVTNNWIHDNGAISHGGGVYLDSGDNMALVGNAIYSNTASHYGGGLSLINSGAAIEGNMIQGNRAGSEAGMEVERSTATLVNNIVADNIKMGFPCASGIGIEDSSVALMHNTIARNRGPVPGSGVYVAAPSLHASVVTFTNNILVSHTVGITVAVGNTATLEATLWGDEAWANETPWSGGGDISTGTINVWSDPGFVDPDGGDYHIDPSSAAIDRGVDAGVMTDVDGDRRPIGLLPDIGADEAWRRVFLPLTLRNHP